MAKRVRISIEVSESFIRLLNAKVQLGGYHDDDRELDPAAVLALVVLGEARGALPEQIHAKIPPQWRPDIEAVHCERRVFDGVTELTTCEICKQPRGEEPWTANGGKPAHKHCALGQSVKALEDAGLRPSRVKK